MIVFSTKKLYIYFYVGYIDYIGDYISNIKVIHKEDVKKLLQIKVKDKDFDLVFEKEKDYNAFLYYFDKYRS